MVLFETSVTLKNTPSLIEMILLWSLLCFIVDSFISHLWLSCIFCVILQSRLSGLAFSNLNWDMGTCTKQWYVSYLKYLITWWPMLHVSHAREESCTNPHFLVTLRKKNNVWEDTLIDVPLSTEYNGPTDCKLQSSFATWALQCFLPEFLLT